MEKHDFIVSTLVRIGFRTSLRGFEQFCRCVELFTAECVITIESIYERVAVDFNCTKRSVEKNLRRLFISSDAQTAVGELYGIPPVDGGNKEIVAMFSKYIMLHRNDYA